MMPLPVPCPSDPDQLTRRSVPCAGYHWRMIGAIFGIVLVLYLVLLAGLAFVVYGIVKVAQSPLTTGKKWVWGLGMAIGYWFFWLPGVVIAAIFLAQNRRRAAN